MTTQEPCASHVLARELTEIAKGKRKELSTDGFDALNSMRNPGGNHSAEYASCTEDPAVTFAYFADDESEAMGFWTWGSLAQELNDMRAEALDDPEYWGEEPTDPSPAERLARAQRLLEGKFEQGNEDWVFGLQATIGDESAFALITSKDLSRGYALYLEGVFTTKEGAIRERSARGAGSADLITIEDLDRMELILKKEGSTHE